MSKTESNAASTQPSKTWGKLGTLLFSAGFGGVIGYLAVGWLIRPRSPMLPLESPGLLLLSLLPMWFVVILTHELGHVFGGWLCGHRFYMLIIGPLRITRDLSGLRAEFSRTFAMSGGLAVSLPVRFDHFVRERMFVIFMGPFASALLAAVCWSAAWNLSHSRSWIVDFLTVTAFLSTLITCITLMPLQAKGFPSDGAQLLGLIRGTGDSEKLTAIMLIQNLSISGTRPRDWPVELLDKAHALRSKQAYLDAVSELMTYSRYMDLHQYDLAQLFLEKALSHIDSLPIGLQQGFALEAAYFWAFHRQDLAKATQWLERGRGGLVELAARSRVEAAVLLLKGELPAALQKIQQARAHLRSSINRGDALAELDILAAMEALAAKPVTST